MKICCFFHKNHGEYNVCGPESTVDVKKESKWKMVVHFAKSNTKIARNVKPCQNWTFSIRFLKEKISEILTVKEIIWLKAEYKIFAIWSYFQSVTLKINEMSVTKKMCKENK